MLRLGPHRPRLVSATALATVAVAVGTSPLVGVGPASAGALGGVPGSPAQGGRIVYVAPGTDSMDIYVASADGSSPVDILPGGNLPAWSPDGTQIAFLGSSNDQPAVEVMNVDGSDRRTVVADAGLIGMPPAWSPDGSRIAFTATHAGETRAYSVPVQGGQPELLGGTGTIEASWSPDGSRLATIRVVGNQLQAAVTNLDGSGAVQISSGTGEAFFPAWSPDGSSIAYEQNDYTVSPVVARIHVAKADGTEDNDISGTYMDDQYPSWSPDGTELLFTWGDGPEGPTADNGLAVVSKDGSGRTPLEPGVLEKDGDWSGLAPAPIATIQAPRDGQTFTSGTAVSSAFACAAGDTDALTSCDDSNGVVTAAGGTGTVDTSTVGQHTYSVTVVDAAGRTSTRSVSYSVHAGSPSASVESPAGSGSYAVGDLVPTSFTCSAGIGGVLAACSDSGGVSTVDGGTGTLDTASAGTHHYTVTATQDDGQRSTSTIEYQVTAGLPTVQIVSPGDGGTVAWRSDVPVTFSCQAAGGVSLTSCLDQDGHVSGTSRLPTQSLGPSTFTVTARDSDGQLATASISFTVVAGPSIPVVACSGVRATIVGTPGPDTIVGSPGRDVIVGRGGDDTIRGLGGHDIICGGSGSDVLLGGTEGDVLVGGRGNDRLIGGMGPDSLFAGAGNDYLSGGYGNDYLAGGTGSDRLVGGPGRDVLHP